jgi:hypothetical protein
MPRPAPRSGVRGHEAPQASLERNAFEHNVLKNRFSFREGPRHGLQRGTEVSASVMLPGKIPYSPHPCIASALLHLQCAKQFSGREDLEGKPPFFVRFHPVL